MKALLKLISIIAIPFVVGLFYPVKNVSVHSYPGTDMNPEYLDGAFTGGFGEETCRSCHFDYDLNMDGGTLSVDGISDTYQAGKMYEITISLQAEQLEVGGFQMTSRFQDGTQAGEFSWEGEELMFTPSVSDNIKYLQHSARSTEPAEHGEISWTFSWTIPENVEDKIIFNVATNSGNDDDSSFGDWIFAKELILKPE